VRQALPDRLVPPAPRVFKASKDRLAPRGPSASRDQLVLPDRPDRSDRRGRRGKPVAKAQSAPRANADHLGRRAPPGHLAQPDRRARRVTLARHQQFAWSAVRIAFAAETMKSWPVLFAQAVRSTELSERRLERPQPVYVYVGDLCHRVATASTFSKSTTLGIKQRHQRSRRFHSKFAVRLYDQFGRLRCVIRFDRGTGSRNRGA
jgi:hypothetical protein